MFIEVSTIYNWLSQMFAMILGISNARIVHLNHSIRDLYSNNQEINTYRYGVLHQLKGFGGPRYIAVLCLNKAEVYQDENL